MNPEAVRSFKHRFALPVLIAVVSLMLAGRVTAQTFTVLHNFTGNDGAHPQGVLLLSGNTLYGTTVGVTAFSGGTAFRLNTDGTGFTNLHSVGRQVQAGLVLVGDTLYGTTRYGG